MRQKRTMYDRQKEDIKDAEKFLMEWQRAIAQRITEKERGLAEKSRVLRNQEFLKLKEDRVVINVIRQIIWSRFRQFIWMCSQVQIAYWSG